MNIKLKTASKLDTKKVQDFFAKYLDEKTPGITNGEFLCPFGVQGAILRKQVVVLEYDGKIIGALRFYPRKRDNIVSVYQFALDEKFRGKGLMKKMLEKTGFKEFEVNCFLGSSFNNYYKKTGWKLEKSDNKFNCWIFKL